MEFAGREFATRPHSSDELVVNEVIIDNCYKLTTNKNYNVVYDIGANVGAFTVLAATRFPRARIMSVEPDPENRKVLEVNIATYNARATIVPKAVWEHSNGIRFHSASGSSAVEIDGEIEVPSITLDELLADETRVDLLKIDIEGGEVPALLAASPETMKKIKRITGEFHGMRPEWGAWVRYLSGFFSLTLNAHPWPNHVYGGTFYGETT